MRRAIVLLLCTLAVVPAALVAYSRDHTGVHYPGDVVAGSLLGGALAQVTSVAIDRRTGRAA